ncbi:cell division protein FtsZ [archaeon]|nr:MAG: cell division protein FtsZ [archaeon]
MKSLIEDAVARASEEEGALTYENAPSAEDEELEEIIRQCQAHIKVVGVGGAGCNAITRLIEVGVEGSEDIAINTDAQDLKKCKANKKILIGREITKGLGAGNDPSIGEQAAREDERMIREAIDKSDMVFVTCGLGGGTGTGAAPIIAEIAKKSNALTVGIVTLPFTVEGIRRQRNAEQGLENLRKSADTVIVIPNDKLLELAPGLPIGAAFKVSDDILIQSVRGITDLITQPGLINLDFADVRSVMCDGGVAMIGMGESDTENRAMESVEEALNSPLIDVEITGARGALINITGSNDLKLEEAERIVEAVSNELDPEAQVIWGAQIDESLKGTVRVLLVLSGVNSPYILGPRETEMLVGEEGGRGKVNLGIDFI